MSHKLEKATFIGRVTDLLRSCGLQQDEALSVIHHLLDCEHIGKPSHGFIRIPKIVADLRKYPQSQISLEKESSVSTLVNGGNKTGLIVADHAAQIAIQKGKESKICIVGGYNITGTVGALGYYTRKIAENNLVGLMVCNSEHAMPATGGYSLIFGTNPLSISIPSDGEPIVIDFATSKMTFGDLMLAMKEGRSIPEDIILDKNGRTSTDPNDAWEGPLLPIAGHKGYCLALAIEILAGPLVNAKAGASAVPGSDGFTLIAIDPELFVSTSNFKSQVTSLINEIKNSKRLPGVDKILLPGESSNRLRLINQADSFLNLPEQLVTDINELYNSLNTGGRTLE